MTTELKDIMSDPEPFRKWLTDREDGFRMQAGNPCECPLARFLQTFDSRAHVYPTGVSINEFSHEIELPCWAEEFVMSIDYEFGLMPLTSKEALEALEEVCRLDHVIASLQK